MNTPLQSILVRANHPVFGDGACKRCGSRCYCVPQQCLCCGVTVCGSYGLARGQCPVCLYGFLSGWSTPASKGAKCGYAGCGSPAVAAAPRVKLVCIQHYVRAHGRAPEAPSQKVWVQEVLQ